MKYYICEACKFQFTQAAEPDRCPDCGKEYVREANEKEIAEFKKLQEEKNRFDDEQNKLNEMKKQL